MKNVFFAGASAVAIMLGGCSWVDSHMPGSSSQSNDSQYSSSQSSSAAQTPAVSGTSQKNDTSAMGANSSAPGASTDQAAGASTDQMGSTSDKSMSHHSMSKSSMGSDRVKQAQQKLKDDGEYQGQVDGKLGPKTAAAVKQYQQKNGLKQTGRLDRDTLGKLGVNSTTGSGSSAPAADSSNSSTMPPTTANPPASQTPAH
jgi:peptidoglycan hydrolase-like protein with peptidoglycan-binding domain